MNYVMNMTGHDRSFSSMNGHCHEHHSARGMLLQFEWTLYEHHITPGKVVHWMNYVMNMTECEVSLSTMFVWTLPWTPEHNVRLSTVWTNSLINKFFCEHHRACGNWTRVMNTTWIGSHDSPVNFLCSCSILCIHHCIQTAVGSWQHHNWQNFQNILHYHKQPWTYPIAQC